MNIWNGFLINLQFFTIIPVRKEINMNKRNLTGMIMTLPLFGLLIGVISAFVLAGLTEYTLLSDLAITLIFITFTIILTGGIHLDGWIDASDAFFLYRDVKKRIQFIEDLRVGAFGVLGLLFLVLFKFLFIFEIVANYQSYFFIYVVFILYFSRKLTRIGLILILPAKKSGLGYLFKSDNDLHLKLYIVYIIPIIIILGIYNLTYMIVFVILFSLIGILHILHNRFFVQQFCGLTGDLSLAIIDVYEFILWMIMWLLHYYVMGGL